MKRNLLIIGILLIVGACGIYIYTASHAGSKEAGIEAAVTSHTSSVYGEYLTDPDGKTLYVYINDPTSDTACTGECLKNWIPYTYESSGSINPAHLDFANKKVSLIKRSDGSYQYAYNKKLLYKYDGDARSGDINGLTASSSPNAWEIINLY